MFLSSGEIVFDLPGNMLKELLRRFEKNTTKAKSEKEVLSSTAWMVLSDTPSRTLLY